MQETQNSSSFVNNHIPLVKSKKVCLKRATGKLFSIRFALATICCSPPEPKGEWPQVSPSNHHDTELEVSQSHYTSLKICVIYIQVDQWLCTFICVFGISFPSQGISSFYFSALSPYSTLTAKIVSQSIASC